MRALQSWLILTLLALNLTAFGAEERIAVGVLKLEVHISRTATLFHVVDQVSEWSYYCHGQYGRAFVPLSDADQVMLEKHRAIRKKHGWGAGLEQTFYSPLSLEEALARGVAQKWISSAEAELEREVLRHFAARTDALFTAQSAALNAFRESLRSELGARAELIAQFARFTGTTPEPVEVYLLPNPDSHNMGGGFNGGRLTVEVPTEADALPTTLHEVLHVFLSAQSAQIETAVAASPGLDAETMNEAIAYAFSPGLIHNGSASTDPLVQKVRGDFSAGKPLSDHFTRYNRYALSLRPLLQSALLDKTQTLATFLPRAIDVWRALKEVELARPSTAAEELKTVTLLRLYPRSSPELPSFMRKADKENPSPSEYFLSCREWGEGGYKEMANFYRRAGHEIRFEADGHPDIKARFNGQTVSIGDGSFQAYGIQINAEDREKIVAGVAYRVKPVNSSETYRWQVSEKFEPVKLAE